MSSNRTFYTALGLVLGALSVGILVLSVLVIASGPRVRHVVVHNRDGYQGVASVDQGLTLVFDRPVTSTDFAAAIELRPKTSYTVSHRSHQLSITFDENLLSNTEYVLTVNPVLEDGTGERMERAYRYEFVTGEPTFTYLERNYDPGAMDRIIQRAPLSQKSQALFEAVQIEYFALNTDYLAVVLPHGDDVADELRVIDRENGGGGVVDVPGNVKIDSLTFSPVANQFAFVTRANIGLGADEAYRKGYDGRLYRYDIDSGRLQPVDTLSDEGNVESVLYSRDGQALLYQTLDGAYYLTGAAGTAEPTLLGSYADSGGFNRTNTKLVFWTDNGGAIYDARTKRLNKVPHAGINASSSTPTFLYNSDDLVYHHNVYNPQTNEALSQITVGTPTGEESSQVHSRPGYYYFGDPVLSYDDRYILMEAAPRSSSVDYHPANPQPKNGLLVLYDRSARRVVEEVHGMDPVWSR